MAEYRVRLIARQPLAEGTLAFHLEKPAGFDHKPGQALNLTLPGHHENPRSPDARHTFSIVTAPHENELVVATRMRDSPFKRALGALPLGTELQLNGPFGSLTLHKSLDRTGVLIAGGIGITPFISMLRQAAAQQTPQDLLLIYSNRRPEDAAFLDELQRLEQQNPRFRLLATMTDMARSAQPWQGETHRLDGHWLWQAIGGLAKPVCYVSGPPPMVEAISEALKVAGLDEEDLRSESFYGY
ncbi:ferredoxin--NADP reductase [Aeromonas eucrenophila]|uniref:Ferredoxin--NADP reductase n=1 Tax=Aeromonas eucrenophila TaxID=649 RepID=A0ABW0YHD1_9GAMM|nr:FAD-dependent oxidoreductase [Aeromonas eucrenophila]